MKYQLKSIKDNENVLKEFIDGLVSVNNITSDLTKLFSLLKDSYLYQFLILIAIVYLVIYFRTF